MWKVWQDCIQVSAAVFKTEGNGIHRQKEKHIIYIALKFVNVDHSVWLTNISGGLADSFDDMHYSKRPVGKSIDVAMPLKYAFY